MEADKDFLKIYWESVYDNNEKKRKFIEVILKNQDEFKGKKINYENIIPHRFKLTSTFKEIILNENEFQIIINWNREKKHKIKQNKIEYKFDINRLKILIDKNGVNFEDDEKKIIIFFK